MKLIDKKISTKELIIMASGGFGNLVKAVVDINKEIMVVDAELHADEEALLLEHGSKQENLWGINLYPLISGKDWIEFDSMINIRPASGNLSRGVDNVKTQNKIIKIVNKLIEK